MVVCLERVADLHMVQLMPLPLTVSCYSRIQIGFTFLVPAHPRVVPEKGPLNGCVCAACWLVHIPQKTSSAVVAVTAVPIRVITFLFTKFHMQIITVQITRLLFFDRFSPLSTQYCFSSVTSLFFFFISPWISEPANRWFVSILRTVVGYAVILVSRDWIRRHVPVFGEMGKLSQILPKNVTLPWFGALS